MCASPARSGTSDASREDPAMASNFGVIDEFSVGFDRLANEGR